MLDAKIFIGQNAFSWDDVTAVVIVSEIIKQKRERRSRRVYNLA